MTTNTELKRFYIVISQTGTLLSRLLRIITKDDYNHASISFCDDLSLMYSFGRINPYNPFFGGFVTESVNFGTFKRFSNTKTIVLSVEVTAEKYDRMLNSLENKFAHKDDYGYNYLGLYLAALKIHKPMKNRYYCSEFIKDFLIENNIDGAKNLRKIVHPMDFINISETQEIYCGKLKDFRPLVSV